MPKFVSVSPEILYFDYVCLIMYALFTLINFAFFEIDDPESKGCVSMRDPVT